MAFLPEAASGTLFAAFDHLQVQELREAMQEDKSIESAVYSTLYLDLVEGLRRQRRNMQHTMRRSYSDATAEGLAAKRAQAKGEYMVMMRAVVADGVVHPLEKSMLREYADKHGLAEADFGEGLREVGWSQKEWDLGHQFKHHDVKTLRMGFSGREPPPAAEALAAAAAASAAASAAAEGSAAGAGAGAGAAATATGATGAADAPQRRMPERVATSAPLHLPRNASRLPDGAVNAGPSPPPPLTTAAAAAAVSRPARKPLQQTLTTIDPEAGTAPWDKGKPPPPPRPDGAAAPPS